jgi:hypothetical protein
LFFFCWVLLFCLVVHPLLVVVTAVGTMMNMCVISVLLFSPFLHRSTCRDPLFTAHFLEILEATGVQSVKLPPRSPNLNAHAERFVRTIKESCLERMILFGEGSVRKAIHEFVLHYHRERNHQDLDNRLIIQEQLVADRAADPAPLSLGWNAQLLSSSGGLNAQV